jgi:hypothetical protein
MFNLVNGNTAPGSGEKQRALIAANQAEIQTLQSKAWSNPGDSASIKKLALMRAVVVKLSQRK